MNLLINYGWYGLIFTVLGEMIIPFILAPFYKGYHHTTMAISLLGNENSPVRLPFNIWMLVAGVLFLASIPSIYLAYCNVSKPLIIIVTLFVGIFAIGACIFSCFFSVNESKDVVTTASKIHGAGSAIGFMLLLFVPLLLSIISFKTGDKFTGIIIAACFVADLVFFILFIMADKPQFQNTIVGKEGLWQRLNLLFMYIPFVCIAIKNIQH